MPAVTATGGRVARNATWRLAATAVDTARAAITVPLIARELGVTGYGAWSVVATVIALAHPLAIGGTTGTIVREAARAPVRAAAIVAAGRRVRFALAIVTVPLAASAAAVLAGGAAGAAAAVLAVGLFLEAAATPAALLAARLRDDLASLARAAGSVAAIAAVLVATAADGGLIAIAAANLAGVAVTTSAARALAARAAPVPRIAAASAEVVALVELAWPITVSCLLAAALLQADVALVDALAGAGEAGVLGASGRVLAVGIAVPMMISAALMPALATLSGAEALALTRRASWVAGAVGVGLGAAMAIGAPLVAAILGPGFEGVEAVLPVLAIRVAIAAASAPWNALLLAARGQRELLAIQLGVFVAAIAASALVVPRGGAVGAAWIAVAGEAIASTLQVRAARRRA